MRVVISDTSCLILYDKIGELEILRNTFSTILVTREVAEEYGQGLPNWINIKIIKNLRQYEELKEELGPGEASSIVLAKEMSGSLLVIDEKRGRRVANELKIEIIGSFGILLKAKEKGVIKSVRKIIEKIDQTNFRISRTIRAELLRRAGE